MGVVSAIMRYCDINLIHEEWLANPMSERGVTSSLSAADYLPGKSQHETEK